MRIREAAALLNVSPDFLRSLEQRGAVPPFSRDLNGHRRLTAIDILRLRAVIYRGDGGTEVWEWAARHGLSWPDTNAERSA
jgi:DNA-binding transcriptional MerR regulator